jgi:hypothetical protein
LHYLQPAIISKEKQTFQGKASYRNPENKTIFVFNSHEIYRKNDEKKNN